LSRFRIGGAIAGNFLASAPLNFVARNFVATSSGENEISSRLRREKIMKYLLSALTALFLFAYLAPDANAFVCARGVYRAGCVGPRGGVVVRRGPRCIWRGGVRVCRW
jgi:hypothetical protein